MKVTKIPAPQRPGTANREARALGVAQKALDELSDDPAAMQMFIAMVPLLGVVRLRNLSRAKKRD